VTDSQGTGSLFSSLASPLYPQRSFVRAGECGLKPLRDLERWVKGASFHPYGIVSWEPQEDEDWPEALDRMRECPGELKIDGKLLDYRTTIEYWVWYRRAGESDAYGGGGPHMTPEDAAYSCLSYIEEHERQVYEQQLVVGLS